MVSSAVSSERRYALKPQDEVSDKQCSKYKSILIIHKAISLETYQQCSFASTSYHSVALSRILRSQRQR
jgi:hypothetical protein